MCSSLSTVGLISLSILGEVRLVQSSQACHCSFVAGLSVPHKVGDHEHTLDVLSRLAAALAT